MLGTVLSIRIFIQRGGHGGSHYQWSNSRIHRTQRGIYYNFCTILYTGSLFSNLFVIILQYLEYIIAGFFYIYLSLFSFVNQIKMQSLMIAAIPNIIGWLAISFAQVSVSKLTWVVACCYYSCYM